MRESRGRGRGGGGELEVDRLLLCMVVGTRETGW